MGLVNVAQGSFGIWAKWFGLNLPWALAPFWFIPGSILELRELYMDEGAQLALASRAEASGSTEVSAAAE